MNKMFGLIFFALSLPTVALSGVKVTSLDLTTTATSGFVNITLDGRTNDLPDIKVTGTVKGVRAPPCIPTGAAQPATAPVTAAAAVP